MRIPTGTMSATEKAAQAGQLRQRTVESDEITAVIELPGMAKDGAQDGDKK
jgi:hypothetical protein